MTDLFNRNRDGSKELEDLTGQWYASSPFRLIETEIRFATDEVARLVSQEVVKEAAEAYDEDEKPELVAAVRLPVACLALMRYAKLSPCHTNRPDGRSRSMTMREFLTNGR